MGLSLLIQADNRLITLLTITYYFPTYIRVTYMPRPESILIIFATCYIQLSNGLSMREKLLLSLLLIY